ncbi:MAG: CDGSH iron-sulfur domain-containing protein [Gammaproteobacteria bacterium]|nr:CDGSH iron-sulfur domain-containing protein [Gammaproteobacteria bacterium]
MDQKKVFDYSGEQVDVHWDSRLCIHIGECGHSEGDLFETGRDPWCIPDTATIEDVAEVCARCPSGALTYTVKNANKAPQISANSVQVTYNGPLYVLGDLNIGGAAQDMPGTRYRAALCRCGLSANKPFCDNSHLKKPFEDFGAVGQKGPGFSSASSMLNITPAKDGPLLLRGSVSITSGSGRVAWQGEETALCRCGASSNKPFCDGSHLQVGFKSD